jgi:hypothetical protein
VDDEEGRKAGDRTVLGLPVNALSGKGHKNKTEKETN